MIKLITGRKGTGKTKILVDMINADAVATDGNVICIDKGTKLNFDIPHSVRIADVDEYEISGFDAFYGFVAGMLAGNFDITEVFVDSILKIGGRDYDALGTVLDKINKISKDKKVVLTISADKSELPDSVKAYID